MGVSGPPIAGSTLSTDLRFLRRHSFLRFHSRTGDRAIQDHDRGAREFAYLGGEGGRFFQVQPLSGPVSYTHLTLPTIYSV